MDRVYIETLGCSKNQVDSEKLLAILEENGYKPITNPEEAEIIIVNTCGFINDAKEEAINVILEFSEYKKICNCKMLIAAGCLVQRYYNEIKDELPEVDLFFGVFDLTKIIDAIKSGDRVYIPNKGEDIYYKRNLTGYPGSAYIKISDGCNNRCSYCAIPLIRGDLKSRTIDSIKNEIEFLKTKNVKEFVFVAQDTTSYGVDINLSLIDLIEAVDPILPNDSWLRILYMHPDNLTDEIIDALNHSNHFIPYFDIPLQSGSDNILKLMGRRNSSSYYLSLIDKIKKEFDNAVIRSTFIVGFPGETEEDFADTLNFIEKARIDWVGGFTYSKEEGTRATQFQDKLPQKTKAKRLEALLDLSESINRELMERFLDTNQKVLIEEKVGDDLYLGRFYGQAPEVDGATVVTANDATLGDFINVDIKKINDKDLFGFES